MLRESAVAVSLRGPDFSRRAEPAELPELMDQPCSYEEFRACMSDLERVNRWTRGYGPTLAFLDRLVDAKGGALPRPLRILDAGSGGGDMLWKVARWARRRGVDVELTGVDLNPHATRAARELSKGRPGAEHIRWVNEDIFRHDMDAGVDVILSALFTHHLGSAEVVQFIEWMERTAGMGWFVNDLRRSERAAWWFRALPVIFRWHRFVRHDGPVSLRRAFTAEDWRRMLAAAGVAMDAAGGAVIEDHSMARLCVARIR